MIELVIIGAGDHGKSAADAFEMSCSFNLTGFLGDGLNVGDSVFGVQVLGLVDRLSVAVLWTTKCINQS